MLSEESVNQKDVAGFLLGLGIGLVVGIVFKPQAEDSRPYRRVTEAGKVAPRNLRPESDENVAKSEQRFGRTVGR